MRRRSWVACGSVMLALAGCGGDDDTSAGGDAAGGSDTTETAPAAGSAPKLDAVLACMKQEGLDAQDQSSSTGETIGVDYPAGRLGVAFEESEEDAAALASVATTNGETAVQKGTVVISSPVDPAAAVGQPIAEGCVEAP